MIKVKIRFQFGLLSHLSQYKRKEGAVSWKRGYDGFLAFDFSSLHSLESRKLSLKHKGEVQENCKDADSTLEQLGQNQQLQLPDFFYLTIINPICFK